MRRRKRWYSLRPQPDGKLLAAGSRDAALLLMLEPGIYTLQISGAGSSSGEALAEIYVIGRD